MRSHREVFRFHPALLRAKEILASGELGAVKSVDVKMKIPRGIMPDSDIRFNHSLGGGAMMDMGCTTPPLSFVQSIITETFVCSLRLYDEHSALLHLVKSALRIRCEAYHFYGKERFQ